MISPVILPELAKKSKHQNKLFFKSIKPGKANLLDNVVHNIHEKVFENINCLECANCCKTLGPRLTERDIRQMAKAINLKPVEFEKKYIKIDEDGDTVFNHLPCPFLMPDNYCQIYENRPKACREYPHTQQPEVLRKKNIHIRNSSACPAVYEILENARKSWK